MITEQIVVEIYRRYLPEDLGAQLQGLAFHAQWDTLYAAATFPAPREGRRATQPFVLETPGLTGANADVAGFLTITAELSESRAPILADGEPRARPIDNHGSQQNPARHSTRRVRDRHYHTVSERESQIWMHVRRCPLHALHRSCMSRGLGALLTVFLDGIKGTR